MNVTTSTLLNENACFKKAEESLFFLPKGGLPIIKILLFFSGILYSNQSCLAIFSSSGRISRAIILLCSISFKKTPLPAEGSITRSYFSESIFFNNFFTTNPLV